MAQVKVLVEGYTSEEAAGRTCPTVTLVRDGAVNIIVDPGIVKSQDVILGTLAKEGLRPQDIGVVFITHSHMDHYRNMGMFPKARALDYWGWWESDAWSRPAGKVSRDVRTMKTPGHSFDGMTLVVKTKEGTVAICGDVFWKEGFPKKDKYATDERALAQSRKLVLSSADFVVPGHGKMFCTGRA